MDGTKESFLRWCRDQRDEARRAYTLYESGTMRFLANNVDVSKEQMASLERVAAEMDALITRIENDA